MTRNEFLKLCSLMGLVLLVPIRSNAKEDIVKRLIKIPKSSMYTSSLGWLESRFHFSFADYIDMDNMNFGVVRVLNDDIIHPNGGFPTHPHKNMEIISYVVRGEITHKDSMGNAENLKRGEVQYLSAGAGITHSEFNFLKRDLRILQIWITPPKNVLKPLYGSHKYELQERKNRLLQIVSSDNGDAKVKIHQDINIYVSELDKGGRLHYYLETNRQIYFVQVEGTLKVNNEKLNEGDAMKISDVAELDFYADTYAHFLFIEMQADEL